MHPRAHKRYPRHRPGLHHPQRCGYGCGQLQKPAPSVWRDHSRETTEEDSAGGNVVNGQQFIEALPPRKRLFRLRSEVR